MTSFHMPRHDHNHRLIACPTCDGEDKTMFQAFASDEVLALYEVDHIDDMYDEDIRRQATPPNPACWIEGNCLECDGPDDGDCGDGEDFHDPA